MMLRDAAVDLLMKRLGNSTDTTLRDDIINEMVQAQETVLEGDVFHPWFLVSEESQSETIPGDERVLLPSDFITMWEKGRLVRYDVTLDDPYIEMTREDWDAINEHLNYSGKPTYYDIAGQYFLMRPLADAVYPLRFWYIKRGESLAGAYGDTATNIENVWLKHASDWLLGETGMVIAEQYLQYTESKIKPFRTQAARGRARVQVINVEMEEVLIRRVMGE